MAKTSLCPETISYARFDYTDLLFSRGIFNCVPKTFVPKSTSERRLRVSPDLNLKQILEILSITNPLYVTGWTAAFSFISKYKGDYLSLQLADNGQLEIKLNCADIDAIKKVDELVKLFNKYRVKNKEANGVWATFTYVGPHGIRQNFEFLKCPRWGAIRENYPSDVRDNLNELTSLTKPWDSGKLLIFSGPAGTGKTYFIRSLMMAWRKKFDFFIVTDPEKYASDPAYYYAIGAKTNQGAPGTPVEESQNPCREKEHSLIILEDSADLILKESRSRHFDKLGKLLNMTDGLLGQGRENVYLITFNEDVEEIDAAFLRPGRCISNIGFTTFNREEAAAWLEKSGKKLEDSSEEKTLAELYAIRYANKAKRAVLPAELRLGFCPS